MKVRNGFVSNSSSASFIIKKAGLSEAQIDAIKRHGEYSKIVDKHFTKMAKELHKAGFDLEDLDHQLAQLVEKKSKYYLSSYFDYQDPWVVKETDTEILLGCVCDNFAMYKFLKFIDVPPKLIKDGPEYWAFDGNHEDDENGETAEEKEEP
jgi:hypothetical protein